MKFEIEASLKPPSFEVEYEIDHSEPSGSCVAISRAGRRPRAHKAARPGAAARATGVNLAGDGQA